MSNQPTLFDFQATVVPDPDREAWLEAQKTRPAEPNPMVKLCGPGPEGATCKTCVHFVGLQFAKLYRKCDERDDLTHGPKTDQKAGWNACSKYEEGKGKIYHQR